MRNLKKFLALVLAMVMAFSLMLTANAAVTSNVVYPDANDDVVTPQFVEAVEVLSGMGIFQGDGDDGGFHAGNNITRAEVAAIIYRLVTADVTDSQAPLYRNVQHPFTDVTSDKWYAGYVGYLWNAGIVKGDTKTTFNPSGNVTGYEALAMILRAVGYDKQNEFSGSSWYQNVASISKNEGILEDVDKTIYAGTLHSPARRDVVASLLFRTAAYVNQVVWTSAFQYTKTGLNSNPVSGGTNPTLGQKWFGLTWDYGVILGNEATGEGEHVTRIRLSNQTWGRVSTAAYGAGTAYDLGGYWYDENADYTDTAPTSSPSWKYYGKAPAFRWDSGLDQFGHAVKVWYNSDSSAIDTYYVHDEVSKTAVVTAGDLDLTKAYSANSGDLKTVAIDNGFTLNSQSSVWWNYSFGPNVLAMGDNQAAYSTSTALVTSYGSNGTAYKSPIKENNSSNDYPLYLLISNSGTNLDMVVALDLTVSQITQQNKTTYPYSVGVTNANGGNAYFDVEDTANVGTTQNYANILDAALVGNSTKTLGDKVVAIEVTGTTGVKLGDGADNDEGNFNNTYGGNVGSITTANPATSNYYYNLNKLTKVVPGTVIDVNVVTHAVTLSDGSVLKRSVFAKATDGTFQVNDHVNAPLVYTTYNFTLDNEGNYIFWEPIVNTTKFVYGTYLDYTTPLNSSTYTYSMVGVDINGTAKVVSTPIISYSDALTPGTRVEMNSVDAYNKNPLPQRDNTAGSGWVKEGQYVGYTIDEQGNLTAVSTEAVGYGGTATNPMIQASSVDFGAGVDSGDVKITERDVLIGAKEVSNNLFLTTNTQFYLVEGAGTDSQKVYPYKGIAELMAGCANVTINGDGLSKLVAGSLDENIPYADMIYYSKSPFTYAQNYNSSAWQVDTVFIPLQAVDFDKKYDSNLVFVGDNTGSVINATGEDAVRFTAYNNGVGASYWIAGTRITASSGTGSAGIVLSQGKNVFYRLVATGKTAIDGQPIYNVAPVAGTVGDASKIVIGQAWVGADNASASTTLTNDLSGSTFSTAPVYKATTYNIQVAFIDQASAFPGADLYNVGSATVKNLDKVTYPGINDSLTDLNWAGSVTTNTGVPVSCVFSADGTTTVSFIYVNA